MRARKGYCCGYPPHNITSPCMIIHPRSTEVGIYLTPLLLALRAVLHSFSLADRSRLARPGDSENGEKTQNHKIDQLLEHCEAG